MPLLRAGALMPALDTGPAVQWWKYGSRSDFVTRTTKTIRHFLKLQHTSCFNENITRIISGTIMTTSSLFSYRDCSPTAGDREADIKIFRVTGIHI